LMQSDEMRRPPALLVLSLLARIIACAAMPAVAWSCEDLARLSLAGTTIGGAESVYAGTFTPPGEKPIQNIPAFCRVAGSVKPTSDSNIQFEVWMPIAGWNGKFQGAGNGGFAGYIDYETMAAAVRHGYATASTDTGHHGTDASWALGHPEKIVDFGYRGIHETADLW
jgi:hypothetical protein